MVSHVYSVKDSCHGFMSPTIDINDETAERNFTFAINNSESVMGFAPADFDLYHVGDFDTDAGGFVNLNRPRLICRGRSVFGKSMKNFIDIPDESRGVVK